jgi:hypothetical protein
MPRGILGPDTFTTAVFDCLTANSAARSTKESIDESMAADPGTG